MADQNKSKALYSSGVAFLGFACFALAATAIGLPLWGYYESPQGKYLIKYKMNIKTNYAYKNY